MKFLLAGINAKYIHSNPAIRSLKAGAGVENHKYIDLAEYTINQKVEEILADLYRRKPDIIGFSCYIWNIETVRALLPELPKLLPDTEVWLGGPEVSFDGEDLLDEYPGVRGIMAGEGEETFRELLNYYREIFREDLPGESRKGKSQCPGSRETRLGGIRGLILREGRTPGRELLSMDALPFLYEDLKELDNRIIYYESSRGCPYRCSYCLSSIDKTVRLRSMDKVKRELRFFLDARVPQVKFIDRTFNCSHSHAMEIWRYLHECDNGITNFHFEIAADILTDEETKLLQSLRPGQVQLEIGVQTTNKETLREICRPADSGHIARVVQRLRERKNIHLHLDLIAGLPCEDYESFAASFNEVYAMDPHQLQLGFLKVLKGSPMARRAGEYGIVYRDRPPYEVLYTKWLSYGELLRLKQIEEMVELYYNSGQFGRTLPALEKCFKGPFSLFEALAVYYERKGYFVNAPARNYRYQALLDFAMETDGEKAELYRELLTFDFYLRENAKTRPSFGRDLGEYHGVIREFYRKEEEMHRYLPDYSGYHARELMRMTHLEVFFYPVWEEEPEMVCRRGSEPKFILFDYEKRDPLTRDARAVVIENQEKSF